MPLDNQLAPERRDWSFMAFSGLPSGSGVLFEEVTLDERIEAAAQYIKANHADLGITAEWRENYDVAVLATFMGVPKEGPSAGITLVTGIVSALTNRPVRNDVAMTGEITIMGKVLPVGGIHAKIRAAYEAGVKEVILPADNVKEIADLPQYVKDAVKLFPVNSLDQVIAKALPAAPVVGEVAVD